MAPCLPTETLHEIALYLPRHVLKSLLLFQPHPVGRIASYLYFSVVSLYFGVRDGDYWYINVWGESSEMAALVEWHEKRSHDILMAIIENDDFAKRVQTLKIYSPGSKDTDALTFQMGKLIAQACFMVSCWLILLTGLLAIALPKMIRLRVLECYGLLMPLRTTISRLSETVPLLQRLRLGYVSLHVWAITIETTIKFSDSVNRRFIPSPSADIRVHRLSHLEQLTLCEGWHDHLSLTDLPKDLEASSIKRLHITCPHTVTDVLTRFTTPALISILTHLSLKTPETTESAFEMALRYGVNLQSLRIEGHLNSPNSQHFRRYAHALPSLAEFGVFLYSDTPNWTDTDFFPAVCDFLRPKAAQLVHLELRAPQEKLQQDRLGFDGGKECWGLFKSGSRSGAAGLFPKLESLSMTLPEGKKSFSFHCSKLIPKGVTRLSLSGYQLVDSTVKNIFRAVSIRSSSTYMTGSSDNHPSRRTVTS